MCYDEQPVIYQSGIWQKKTCVNTTGMNKTTAALGAPELLTKRLSVTLPRQEGHVWLA